MPIFQGGPQDGQTSIDPSLGDPTFEQMLGQAGGPQGAGGPPGAADQDASAESGEQDNLDPAARFDRIISDVRTLLTDDGEFTDQEKLTVSKVETLLQQFKAGREKEQHQAMGGKLSPGLMQRAYSGGSSGGPGY